MPVALFLALAASLGLHAAALFGPDVELAPEPEALPIMAELRPLPKPMPMPLEKKVETAVEKVSDKSVPAKSQKKYPRPAQHKPAPATPVLQVPESVEATPLPDPRAHEPASSESGAVVPDSEQEAPLSPAEPRLPPSGMIRYRVDRGDSGFEIGFSLHEWQIDEGHYRLRSVSETTGLAWLIKSIRVEMESVGTLTEHGLRPDRFVVRRNGRETKEKAAFDWENRQVSVGERGGQPLADGAQDLLSFNYQLGYMEHPEAGGTLPIATGKKYGVYRLEVLGDETIEVPAGVLRTLHLRAPGVNTTELWLAYDYLLLPVKIRHVDSKGESFVQVATEIQLEQK